MRNIGSSNKFFASSIPLQGQYSFRGPTGPTGETGPSSTLGNTGNTGSTGAGIILVGVNYPDGLSLYLNNGLVFGVTGVSGNTATTEESRIRSDFSLRPLSITSINTLFSGITVSGGASRQSGFTLFFTSLSGKGGLSLYYSGDDLVFHGITTSNKSLGATGSILGAYGNTAFGLMDTAGNPVFKYTETTVGITTGHLLSGTINQFIQIKNITGITNINLTPPASVREYLKQLSNTSSYIFNNINQQSSVTEWTNRFYYNTTYSGVTTTIGTTFGEYPSRVFRSDSLAEPPVKYTKRKMGSCCYCDGTGKKRCLDYTTEDYCVDYIQGTFLSIPCSQRRSADCDDWGACCLPGRCVDSTRALCVKFGGTFRADRICSQGGACL